MTEQRLESVEVPKEIYNEMVRQIEWLECLEAAGVDNWAGVVNNFRRLVFIVTLKVWLIWSVELVGIIRCRSKEKKNHEAKRFL